MELNFEGIANDTYYQNLTVLKFYSRAMWPIEKLKRISGNFVECEAVHNIENRICNEIGFDYFE